MNDQHLRAERGGLLAGLSAYLIWGFLPVYFVAVAAVEPLEVLAHRVIWAVPFGALILSLRGQWREVAAAVAHRGTLVLLIVSALIIAANWLIYIWAIQDQRIVETSLGYFINPLIHMLFGVTILGERLRRLQVAAVILAAAGVTYLTVWGGSFPWVAISLAVTFAVYALIRKQAAVGALPGLFIETVLLLPAALAWFGMLWMTDTSSIRGADAGLVFCLLMAGPITALPLLCFSMAARRLTLTTIGFMQFLAPTLQFLSGLYYGESLTTAHVVCFSLIWTAIAIFSYDALRFSRRTVPRSSSLE